MGKEDDERAATSISIFQIGQHCVAVHAKAIDSLLEGVV